MIMSPCPLPLDDLMADANPNPQPLSWGLCHSLKPLTRTSYAVYKSQSVGNYRPALVCIYIQAPQTKERGTMQWVAL